MHTLDEYVEDLKLLLGAYDYQPALTVLLDASSSESFDQARINEIVLWKVNRYAPISEKILKELNSMSKLKPGEHQQAKTVLVGLLSQRGVQLAMASTLLRFRNPEVFQIIDQRAYRVVFGSLLKQNLKPDAAIKTYMDYLDRLIEIAIVRNVPFRDLDRVLYLADKDLNADLNLDGSKKKTNGKPVVV